MKTPGGIAYLCGRVGASTNSNNIPLVLFSHATGFCKEIWSPVISEMQKLISSSFDWIALDFSGHGDSRPWKHRNWVSFAAEDISEVLNAQAIQKGRRIIGVGHSMGGACTSYMELTHPGTFSSMVLFEPIILPRDRATEYVPGGEDFILSAMARKRKDQFANWDEAKQYFYSRKAFAKFRPDALQAYVLNGLREESNGTLRLKCDRNVEAETYYGSASISFIRESFTNVQCPVVVVSGEETAKAAEEGDPLATDFREIASLFPKSQFVVAPNCGHFLVLEDPAFTATVIASTIQQQNKL